jgi:hypothetical protein
MSAAVTAHSKIVTLLGTYSPSPTFEAVYDTHEVADLDVPSISVEIETDIPLEGDSALVQQELVDNRNIRLSIRIHTGYRLGPVDTDTSATSADEVVRWLRENINLGGGYRIFTVSGVAYNVEHASSGTTGAEINVDIHKVEFYEQA